MYKEDKASNNKQIINEYLFGFKLSSALMEISIFPLFSSKFQETSWL